MTNLRKIKKKKLKRTKRLINISKRIKIMKDKTITVICRFHLKVNGIIKRYL